MKSPLLCLPFVPRFLLAVFLLVAAAGLATAQVNITIGFKRKLYVVYEPILATVTIDNLSGRPLLLENNGRQRWFGFTIEAADGRLIPPNNPDYELSPAAIAPGEKLSRTVNLTPLFPLQEFGAYRIKATVYAESFGRYFSSAPLPIEITEGHQIWQEVVGVPGNEGKPELRTITLLSHKLSRSTRLYARIEDKDNGKIYAMHQLGPYLTFGQPDVMLDARNEVHILQNSAPKEFVYTHLGLQGEVLAQQAYLEAGSRPSLVKGSTGEVKVVGGRPYTPGEQQVEEQVADKVGDRPVPMPGS